MRDRNPAADHRPALCPVLRHQRLQECWLRRLLVAAVLAPGVDQAGGDAVHCLARRPLRPASAAADRHFDDDRGARSVRGGLQHELLHHAWVVDGRMLHGRPGDAAGLGDRHGRRPDGLRERVPGGFWAHRVAAHLGDLSAERAWFCPLRRRHDELWFQRRGDLQHGVADGIVWNDGSVLYILMPIFGKPRLRVAPRPRDQGEDT
mmetsp:Transcript_53688/g.139845  ORF Transcript_53688/g.139845 Transcript_53688/m.139845 type:complete len:205 (-) Transcript_53688:223-837(-)